MPKASKAAQANMKYANAQADEALARGSFPDSIHENVPAALKAKAVAVEAMDEIYNMEPGEKEDTVTLTGPNDRANITDANGVRFVDGQAEDVPQSVADYYVSELEGYSTSGGESDSGYGASSSASSTVSGK